MRLSISLAGLHKIRNSAIYASKRTIVTSRKHILPVLKAIHPDLFAQRDAGVQQDNLECVQTLNDLWDSMNKLESGVDNSSAPTVAINSAFKASYTLKCHVELDDGSLRVTHMKVDAPPDLCLRQMISRNLASKYVQTLHQMLSIFFKDLNIEYPKEWRGGISSMDSNINSNSNSNSFAEKSEDFKKFLERDDIQSLIVDNIVKNSNMTDQNPLIYKTKHTRQSLEREIAMWVGTLLAIRVPR